MTEKIECKIDESLQDEFDGFNFPDYLDVSFLESNQSFSEALNYSVLILNDENFPLNSDKRFRSEENFDVIAYYRKRENNPTDVTNACCVLLAIYNKPGVLSFEQIETLTNIGILIYGANKKNIQSASYDLNLHDEYLRSGVEIEKKDTISIDPFAYVVVGSKEFANLPTNICATYDLQVSMFCRGIILSNGPQVDPGYRGALLALLFNTSSKQFDMEQYKGYDFATIQFLALSFPSKRRYSGDNLLKKSLGEYIRQYADETMSEKVATILSLKGDTDTLNQNVKTISKQVNTQKNKLFSHDTSIANLEGKHTKWVIYASCIIGTVAVVYSAIATFSGNTKVYDLGILVGNFQQIVDSAKSQIKDLEIRSESLMDGQNTDKDKILKLTENIDNLQQQLDAAEKDKILKLSKKIDSMQQQLDTIESKKLSKVKEESKTKPN